jgi:hypothetical protein
MNVEATVHCWAISSAYLWLFLHQRNCELLEQDSIASSSEFAA